MRIRSVAVAVVVALAAAACSNSSGVKTTTRTTAPRTTATSAGPFVHVDQPGVSDTEIHVGSVTSTTNPLGGNYGELNAGIKAYFEMVNGGGGLYGRKLRLTSERDDAVANNQAQVQAMLSQDNVFSVFVATLLFTGADLLQRQAVPTFGWNINSEFADKDHLFGNIGAICFGCTGRMLPYVASKIGAKRVGVLAYGISQQSKEGAAGTRESFKQFPTAQVAYYDDSLPFGVPDLSAQVAAMKRAGVDFVAADMDFNGVFTLAKEMQKQGLKAVQWLPNAYDHDFMAANGQFFEGDYVETQFVAWEHTPRIKQVSDFLDWTARTGGKQSELSMTGWIVADMFVTGLRKAGPDFSRQKLVDALNSGIYDPGGLIEPIDWRYRHGDPTKPGHDSPIECFTAVQVEGGKFVPAFTDKGPWNCFDGRQQQLGAPITLDEARQILAQGPLK